MTGILAAISPTSNRLLMTLQGEERDAVAAKLELFPMRARQHLYKEGEEITHVYFPQGAVASVTKTMEDGRMVEIASIGMEGFVGVVAFLGGSEAVDRSLIQISGPDGFRMAVADFTFLLKTHAHFHDVIRRYTVASLAARQQSVACNGLHNVLERCSRWLLLSQDRVQASRLELTHDFLAVMLGVRRPSVTLALGELQKAGLIDASRGALLILDRARLEQASCECYETVNRQYSQLMPDCQTIRMAADSTRADVMAAGR